MRKANLRVHDYKLYASNGKYIRKATEVVFPNGQRVRFLERLPKSKAIPQAKRILWLNFQTDKLPRRR